MGKVILTNLRFQGLFRSLFILFIAVSACQKPNDSGVKETDQKTPSKPIDKPIDIEEDSTSLKIEYLAHASFLLKYGGHTLLLDPFADSVWISYIFPRNISADAIFSTHPHYDHDGGIFRDLKPYWQGKIPFFQDPGKYQNGPFKITGLKGKHCDPYGMEFDQKNTIFIFEVGGLRLAHWGDNGPISDVLSAQLMNLDVLFLPIDDTYHILKEDETREVIAQLKPKIVIPMHYKIASLEPTPGKPKNLGTIEQYIKDHPNTTMVEGNKMLFDTSMIPETLQYFVFEHSPSVGN